MSFLKKMKYRAINETAKKEPKLEKKIIEVKEQVIEKVNEQNKDNSDIVYVMNMFETLKNTSGKKDKEDLLTEYVKNNLFMTILKFLCDTLIVTGISKKKISKQIAGEVELNENVDLYVMLKYIQENNTGKDENVLLVQQFIRSQPEECYDFLIGIFTKSYKCGVTAKTLNKIVPNSIIEHSVMLAETFKKHIKKVIGKLFVITEKLDGQRITAIKSAVNKVEFYSRQGLKIEQLIDIEKEFLDDRIPIGVYDGELLATGHFTESKDQYKETMKRCRIKGPKTGLKFVCFDYIENIDDFLIHKIDKTPFIERKEKLLYILREEVEGFESLVDRFEYIDYLDNLYIGDDLEEIKEIFESVITFGGEGVMINIANAPYECKRTANILKYKEFKTADVFAIEVLEGDNDFVGTLGSIVVDYKGNRVKVGSGLDRELRDEIWNSPDLVIGKIITVQYFEETTNDQGGTSIRFPVFIDIRDDKTEPSYED